MIYRALDINGDYQFGGTFATEFLINTPAAVAQAVLTRLRLLTGEWFLDVTEGTPYSTQILGAGTMDTYNLALRDRILGTPGVVSIANYSSTFSSSPRSLNVAGTLNTIYGATSLTVTL